MATLCLIIGESGSGKSTSMRTLDPKETFLVNVMKKPLPFKGWKKSYTEVKGDAGNFFNSDESDKILSCFDYVNAKRPDIKNIVVDDFQGVMLAEFMKRSKEKGYEKWSDIANHTYNLIYLGAQLARQDLVIFFLSHSELSDDGTYRAKTIGKLLSEKLCIEGMFTIVLHAVTANGEYKFITQNTGKSIAKSPMEMFPTLEIPNDLSLVAKAIREYNS
jgi:hypothetical protein